MSAYLSREHNAAILAAVQAICTSLSPIRYVGDGDVPAEVKTEGVVTTYPYAVIYPLGASTFDGSMASDDLDSDAFPTTQVTFVGVSREQSDWLRDQVRAGLVGTHVVVQDRKVGPVRLHAELPSSKDTTVTPYVFWCVDHYRAFSTPA
jgi:hypothetical protein